MPESRLSQEFGPILYVADVPLGPVERLRLAVVPGPSGEVLELRIWRASPAEKGPGRFRSAGDALQVPTTAFVLLEAELKRVGHALAAFGPRRPTPARRG